MSDPTKLTLADQRRWLAGLKERCTGWRLPTDPDDTVRHGLTSAGVPCACHGTSEVPLIDGLASHLQGIENAEFALKEWPDGDTPRYEYSLFRFTAAFTVALLEWLDTVVKELVITAPDDVIPVWDVENRYEMSQADILGDGPDIHTAVVRAAVQVAIARE